MNTETPATYLSKTERAWILIHRGMPLCAETTKENAKKMAAYYKIILPEIYWDGLQGKFESEI